MPRYCSAVGCQTADTPTTRSRGITFHRFPKDEALRKEWQVNAHKENWTCAKHSVLCSAHFEERMFNRTGLIARLHQTAVPTLFDSLQLQKPEVAVLVTPLKEHQLPAEPCRPCSSTDHDYTDDENPRILKRKLDTMTDKFRLIKKKLKVAQQTTRRLKKKVRNLKNIIDELKEKKNLMSDTSYKVLLSIPFHSSVSLIGKKKQRGDRV